MGAAQGKKVDPTPLRLRRSRRSRSSARSGHQEARCVVRRTAFGGEGVAKTGFCSTKTSAIGQEETPPWAEKGGSGGEKERNDFTPAPTFVGRAVIGRLGLGHRLAGDRGSRQNARPGRPDLRESVRRRGTVRAPFPRVATVRSDCDLPTAERPGRAGMGLANPVIRAQAVQPITIAPSPAKTSRHTSESMPIWDSPSTA
jgi:hypothetical protein